MDPWQKESLGLQVGDFIIWRDEAIEMEGQPAVVAPGMKGEVISLHDGFHLDVAQVKPIPPKAIVQFEEALSAYDTALARSPGRFNSLYGAGRAAELKGDLEIAHDYYDRLVEASVGAGNKRPRLAHAREVVRR